MPTRKKVQFPKLAKAVRAAIRRLGISNAEAARRIFPDGRAGYTGLYPLLGGIGRLLPGNRPALEQALGLDASIWQLDGIPDSPFALGKSHAAQQRNGEAGPVGRALALAAATVPAGTVAPAPARFVNEVAVVFRDGRAHLRINAMVSASEGLRVMAMLQELIGEGEHDGAGSTHGGDGTDQPGTRRPGADR